MPPANSPNSASSRRPGSTPRSPASPSTPPQSYPEASLNYFSSPVADLAATLRQTSDEEADEANVNFLRDSLESLDQAASGERNRQSRSHVDTRRDPRRTSTQPATGALNGGHLDDLSRRERLQRVLARLNRIHDPVASSVASAYGNRTPSPHRQRLYDWAPSQDASAQEESELEQILAELRRQQPDTHPDILRVLSQSQLDSSRQQTRGGTSEAADVAERRDRLRERRRRDTEWVSRRAVLQRARQESSPSATERMLRHVMDRERSGLSEEEERARGTGWFSPAAARPNNDHHRNSDGAREPWPLPPAGELRARTLQERAEVMQRRYLSENASARQSRMSTPPIPTHSVSSSPQFLESALKYLDRLRSCFRYEDALSVAIDHGLATKEFFADKHDDFVMDLEEVDSVAISSWLQSGAKFEGHQHATSSTAGILQPRQNSSLSHSVEQINPNFRTQSTTTTGSGSSFDHPPGSTRVQPFDASRPWLSHQFMHPTLSATSPHLVKSPELSHDHWPVRVILHSIDTERMTLQGTMEAYDVPQHSPSSLNSTSTERPKAGKKNAPITTYLEGHIIDLATHSFLTPSSSEAKRRGPHATSPENQTPYTTLSDTISFPSANAHTDASNWRKLPPFDSLSSDEETARCFLSKARMSEVYSDYVFMRWKERCFVHTKDDKCSEAERGGDQDRGHGLTISGFYYVSLRRSDGLVEGLYFDPMSTPYQHLKLKGHRTGWPAVELR